MTDDFSFHLHQIGPSLHASRGFVSGSKNHFQHAEALQPGSAAYNLACIAALCHRPADAIHKAWETLRAGLTETPFLTLTGYGRQLVDFADKQVTEISCHGLGARLLAPDTRTVIDIGGQDSKVIQLDAGGNLSDFLMNDKCAAGTGRFLEVISRTLGASVEQLDAITDGVEPHAITSMCTVFAESEVISLRSAGVAPEAILAGVINAMARRSANFIGRV